MFCSGSTSRQRSAAALLAVAALWPRSPLPAAGVPGPERIQRPADLGLTGADVPVSAETKVVFLVNPALNRPRELEAILRALPDGPAGATGSLPAGFREEEVRILVAPARPGDTTAYGAVSDVAEQFLKFMFSQVPETERSLHRLVQQVSRRDFPLVAFDAAPRVVALREGKERWLDCRVSVRLFMIHVEGERERGLSWVTRCELCFEDSASGRAPLRAGADPAAALASSVIDALRGKIAVSFARSPALRRPSGRVDQPRPDLIDASISEGPETPTAPASGPPASGPPASGPPAAQPPPPGRRSSEKQPEGSR